MRHPLQSIITAALVGCLLALLAAGFWSKRTSAPTGVTARHQTAPNDTPTPAASSGVRRGSASATSPTSGAVRATSTPVPGGTRPAPRTALILEPGASLPLEVPYESMGEPPVESDKWDVRPPRGPMSFFETTIHRVEAGDTVYHLAARYGVSWEAILAANRLDEQGARSLDIGQELVIPAGFEGHGGPPPAPQVVHQVQSGEALIAIARDYGTTVESIVVANELADAELILAGQELIVPVPPGTQVSPPVEPMSETEPVSQTNALAAAPQLAPAEPVSPTLSLTQPLVMTQTTTVNTAPEPNATEAISAEPLAETSAITETNPTEPMTDTVGIEEAPTPEALTDMAQSEAGPSAELAALEAAMVEAVNAERGAHGLPAYRVDEALSVVARAHAHDMVARHYVGHTSPEGQEVRDRLRDAGLDLDRAGENYYVSTRPPEAAVAHTLSWFMGDPPHRNNLLHDHYTRMGVGVAYEPTGWYIFVLDFAED